MESKRYWLRAGVVLGGLSLVINLLSWLLAISTSGTLSDIGNIVVFIQIIVVGLPALFVLRPSGVDNLAAAQIIILIVWFAFVAFVVGAIIGWAYGKIKNRSAENNF